MKIINVELEKIRVSDLSVRNGLVFLEIFFDDGKKKEISRNTKIENPDREAENIIKEIRQMEKNINQEFNGEKFFDSYTNVVIQDEEKVTEKMTGFLKKIKDKMVEVRSLKDATGFLDKINAIKLMKLEFFQ